MAGVVPGRAEFRTDGGKLSHIFVRRIPAIQRCGFEKCVGAEDMHQGGSAEQEKHV